MVTREQVQQRLLDAFPNPAYFYNFVRLRLPSIYKRFKGDMDREARTELFLKLVVYDQVLTLIDAKGHDRDPGWKAAPKLAPPPPVKPRTAWGRLLEEDDLSDDWGKKG